MDSLFKLILYLIIIIFWALNNTKKQKKWEKDLPILPKPPDESLKKPVQEPASLEPARQDIFDQNIQADMLPDASMISYEQILETRREKAKARKNKQLRKKPVLEAAPGPETKAVEAKTETAPPLSKETKKPALYLKSSIKEGIIWSIILGPARSREHFNWKNSPIQR